MSRCSPSRLAPRPRRHSKQGRSLVIAHSLGAKEKFVIAAARPRFALFLSVLFLCVMGSSAWAAPTQGTEYELLTPPQAPLANGKVEVIEFFSYGCPHCA